MADGVLALDAAACQDVAVAGAKATGLSRARSHGLPALPGYVVTTDVARPALAAGREAFAHRGSGGARLAAQSAELPEGLLAALAYVLAELGGPVIVRSSSTVEGDGVWSGAFSSFSDVETASVGTAVKGCWSSMFSVDALERAEHSATELDSIEMAVLIQPLIVPRVSGHARLAPNGVEITAVAGAPAALMSGWVSGDLGLLAADGGFTGPAAGLLSVAEAAAVADVVRRCDHLLGHASVEWAIVDDDVVLLQSNAVAPAEEAPTGRGVAQLVELDHPVADRVARLVHRFPGGLSEGLVLPWALGLADPTVLDAAMDDPGQPWDLSDLQRDAAAIADHVWADVARTTGLPWTSVLRDLRSEHPGAAFDVIEQLRTPPIAPCVTLIRSLSALGLRATEVGGLRRPDEVFGCELSDLEAHRALDPRQSWAGPRRWEPFLAGVTQTRGVSVSGLGASPGVGAGAVQIVRDIEPAGHAVQARRVIVAEHPVPSLAPLLWNAAALVTRQGSHGAHLLEVAHALGVPAVVHCTDLPLDELTSDVLVAVDGDSGQVTWHTLDGSPAQACA